MLHILKLGWDSRQQLIFLHDVDAVDGVSPGEQAKHPIWAIVWGSAGWGQ